MGCQVENAVFIYCNLFVLFKKIKNKSTGVYKANGNFRIFEKTTRKAP